MNNIPEDLQTIENDLFDEMIASDVVEQSPELNKIIGKGQEKLKTFDALAKDVFYSLYKYNPELREETRPEAKLNKAEIEKLLESPAYHELRQYTTLDEFGAGIGSKTMLEELLIRIEQDEELQKAVQMINDMMEGKEPGDIDQTLQGMQGALRRAISGAAQKASNEVEQNNDVIRGWGLEQGEFQRLPFKDKAELMKRIRTSSQLKNISKLAGKLRAIASSTRKSKLDVTRVELHSITIGDNIAHLLPSELIMLTKPSLKTLLYKKLMEKQALQYHLQHNESSGKGHIIALLDGSGSMTSDYKGSTRDGWAKATALGLLEIAQKERRHFAWGNFSSVGQLITGEFEYGKATPNELLRLAESFWDGGTDFNTPLDWAMKKLTDSKYEKADVIMITDGQCSLDSSYIQLLKNAKQLKKFSIYMVLIGESKEDVLRYGDMSWVDHIWDGLDENSTEELFKRI